MDVHNNHYLQRLGIRHLKGLLFIDVCDIVFCKSDGNYCQIYLLNHQKYTLSKKLKAVEAVLPPDCFARIHHQYVVNMHQILDFNREDMTVCTTIDLQIPVAQRRKQIVMDFFEIL